MSLESQNKKRLKKIWFVLLPLMLFVLIFRANHLINRKSGPTGEMNRAGTSAENHVAGELVVATTTSLADSGLLDLLIPDFEKESGLKVKVIAAGTGEALEMGRRQVADLLLVHAPELELRFMEEGFGLSREEIMMSEMVIAGPAEDKAGIKDRPFVEAFTRIASGRHLFVSRADKSGTHHLEMKIWQAAGRNPSGDWYLQSGQGMSESLLLASEKKAYILTDYPTFDRLRSRLGLMVLTRDPDYRNVYSAIVVRNLTGKVNTIGAEALVNFLVSPRVQKMIADYSRNGPGEKPVFRPVRQNSAEGE